MWQDAALRRSRRCSDAEEYLYFLAQTLPDEDTPGQCAFVESALSLSPASRVLDLGCGHGRRSIELARRGHRPAGIDLVPGFIERAHAEAARERLGAEFVCGDMRAFASPPEFDAAICLFDAFGFHVDTDQALVLDRVLVRPGGRLLLDVRTREHFVRGTPASLVEMANGDLMIDRFQLDVGSGRMIVRRTCPRHGRQRETVFSVRVYSYSELRDLLLDRGFQVLRACGGYDGAPLSASRPRTLVIAGKPLPE